MAFSTFLRAPACKNLTWTQQMRKLTTQTSLQRPVASLLPASTQLFKELTTSTPIINSVRSLRTTPVMSGTPHDHSKLWVIEKGVAVALVPLVPLGLLLPNKLFDAALAILITAHSFWGLEAIAIDYVRPSVVGPILPKIALGLVYLICIATLGGLFYIISHDVGIGNMIRQIWSIKSDRQKS
ncbi:hypothetical protein PYW08_007862 [Mythimna loreyi]|uniref:Uncharacterized protein n=1 Tax=Mythimna loreyi TaxID=667449 RepID=A0ACC2QDJ7_9NEOP|nr:hypothetical protein PYW08_007862 [Mythimna loreyi]